MSTTKLPMTGYPIGSEIVTSDRYSADALVAMSDAELDQWVDVCATMNSRPAIAATARRQWKWLLEQALAQRERRRCRDRVE